MIAKGKQVRFVRWLLVALLLLPLSRLTFVSAQDEGEEYSAGVQMVAEGLTAPVAMASPNDGSGRLFVVDQTGEIWIISPDGQLMPNPFLDLSGLIVPLRTDYDERGALGLAFHPDYANNGRVFVYYSAPLRADGPAGWDHTNVLSEFSVSKDNPEVADLASEKIVLQIDQPQFNHDSGHITFGPDGFLYIPIGDGGGANDTDMGHTPNLGNGQDTTNLHGSILRIDVNGNPGAYSIPPDNPFADGSKGAPEIYAYGFRNPYHISFDRGGNHELFAADAGQDLYEEVDIVTAGGNYGWNIKEGTHCFDPNNPKQPPTECAGSGEPLIDPIIEYSHEEVGVVVVGGYVYRGSALSDLEGYYIFGDYTRSLDGPPDGTLLWAEASDNGGIWKWAELKVAGMDNNRMGAYIRAIGEGDDGELYIMTNETLAPTGDTGRVWKLVPSEGTSPETTSEPGAEATNAPEATQPGVAATTAPGTTQVPAVTEQSSG